MMRPLRAELVHEQERREHAEALLRESRGQGGGNLNTSPDRNVIAISG
jgi:hypothetical protein